MEGDYHCLHKRIPRMMHQDEVRLQLHNEELKVSKKWVETADLKVYKNTYTEEKLIAVPITREELVIEKKDATCRWHYGRTNGNYPYTFK